MKRKAYIAFKQVSKKNWSASTRVERQAVVGVFISIITVITVTNTLVRLVKLLIFLYLIFCCILSLFYVHFSVSYCYNEARICIQQIPDCYSIRTYLGVL